MTISFSQTTSAIKKGQLLAASQCFDDGKVNEIVRLEYR